MPSDNSDPRSLALSPAVSVKAPRPMPPSTPARHIPAPRMVFWSISKCNLVDDFDADDDDSDDDNDDDLFDNGTNAYPETVEVKHARRLALVINDDVFMLNVLIAFENEMSKMYL